MNKKTSIVLVILLGLTNGCSTWSYERDASGKEKLLKNDFFWKREVLVISRETNGTVTIQSNGSQTDAQTISTVVSAAVQGAVKGAKGGL